MRLLVPTLLLLVGAAHAAPPAPAPAAAPPVAGPIDPDTESARRHFTAGLDHYEAGRYREAVVEFEIANRNKPLPDLEYNIGRTYDRLEKYDLAIEHYEKYLGAQTPGTPDNAEIRARVGTLKSRIAEQQQAAAKAEATLTATRPVPVYKKWWLWTAVGGVVVVGVGLGVGLGLGLRKNSAPGTDLGTFRPEFP